MEFETEKFIAEIRSRPPIWDKANYPSWDTRFSAWDEVCTIFCEGYADKTKVDKENVQAKLQRKWKSLRDSFTRELSHQRKEMKAGIKRARKRYTYFDQLSFLKSFKTEDSDGELEEDETSLGAHFLDTLVPETSLKTSDAGVRKFSTPTPPPQKQGPTALKRKNGLPEVKVETGYPVMELQQEEPPPPKRTYVHQPPEEPCAVSLVEDEDRMFLLSLVREMKRIPEDLKLDFKTEMLQLFQKWRRMQ